MANTATVTTTTTAIPPGVVTTACMPVAAAGVCVLVGGADEAGVFRFGVLDVVTAAMVVGVVAVGVEAEMYVVEVGVGMRTISMGGMLVGYMVLVLRFPVAS